MSGEAGLERDDAQAVAHWKVAAAHGLASAQYNLGTMYSGGRGTAQDHMEAIRLYGLAAAQGFSSAYYSLGYVAENGLGVPVDLSQAIEWYQLASSQADGDFCHDAKAALRRLNFTCHLHELQTRRSLDADARSEDSRFLVSCSFFLRFDPFTAGCPRSELPC
jgi:TPR repeat protein